MRSHCRNNWIFVLNDVCTLFAAQPARSTLTFWLHTAKLRWQDEEEEEGKKAHEEITVVHLLHYCCVLVRHAEAKPYTTASPVHSKIDSWIYVCTRYNEYLHFVCAALHKKFQTVRTPRNDYGYDSHTDSERRKRERERRSRTIWWSKKNPIKFLRQFSRDAFRFVFGVLWFFSSFICIHQLLSDPYSHMCARSAHIAHTFIINILINWIEMNRETTEKSSLSHDMTFLAPVYCVVDANRQLTVLLHIAIGRKFSFIL